MKCNNVRNCRECKHNLMLDGKTKTMQDFVEYFIVYENGEVNTGSKMYFYFMQRYGDVVGACEVLK